MKRLKLLFTMLLLTMSSAVFAQKGTTMEDGTMAKWRSKRQQ